MNMEFILKQLYEVYLDQLGIEAEVIVTKKENSNEPDKVGA